MLSVLLQNILNLRDRSQRDHNMRLFIAFFAMAFSLVAYPDFSWSSQRLPDARVGEPYEYVVTIKGLVGPLNFDWNKGDKPSWVQFSGPVISGTPSEARKKPYTLRLLVTDAFGKSISAEYQLSVRPKIRPLSINTEYIPPFPKGQDSRFEVMAVGGEGNYRWTECRPILLPEGLVAGSGDSNQYCVVKGCAKETGKIHLKVTVSDENKNTQTKELYGQVVELAPSLKFVPSLKIGSFIPPASLNVPYYAQLTAIGGTSPYTWDLEVEKSGDLSWIVLDKKTGILSGTPDKITREKFSVELKDGTGQAVAGDMWLVVKPMPLKLITKSLPTATQNVPYSAQLVAIGGHLPYSWDIDVRNIRHPPWISIDPKTGILAGTPDSSGVFTITVQTKDAARKTVVSQLKLPVEALKTTEKMPAKSGTPKPKKPKIDKPKPTMKKTRKEDKVASYPAPGNAALKDNEYPKAKDKFKAVIIKLDPKDQEADQKLRTIAEKEREENKRRKEQRIAALLAQGKTALSRQQFDEARRSFHKVLRIDRTNKLAKASLDRISDEEDRLRKEKEISYLLASGDEALKVPDYKEARQIFTNVLRLDPNNMEARKKLEAIGKKEQRLEEEKAKQKEFALLLASAKERQQSREYEDAKNFPKKVIPDVLSPDSIDSNFKGIAHDGRFIAYANGTVLDTKTNLIWAATDSGNGLMERDVDNFIKNYHCGGYADWRLPSMDELETIFDRGVENHHNYHVTKLIDITGEWVWALGEWVPKVFFSFSKGVSANIPEWGYRTGTGFSVHDARILPVRTGN